MDEKKEKEIRKLLGDRFHLGVEYKKESLDGPFTKTWKLYRRYTDFAVMVSEDNKCIMSSETNTADELLDFAKRHRILNEARIVGRVRLLIVWIAAIAGLINMIFFHNHYVSAAILGIDIIAIIEAWVSFTIDMRNSNVEYEEIKQYLLNDNLK